ncbi:hypothetical protein ACFLXX_02450 [Chloroflexota bacterium]
MIATVTTVTTAALGLTSTIVGAVIVTLIVLLATREVVSASYSPVSSRIAKFTKVGILPLVMAFAVTVVVEIAKFL